jgi:cell division septation protein DedD
MRPILALVVLAWLLPAAAAHSSEPGSDRRFVERPEEELLLLAFELRHRRLADAIPAWPGTDDVLLPLGELSRLLGLGIEIDVRTGTAQGFLVRQDQTFTLDAAAGRVEVAGSVSGWDPGEVEVHREDLFVASRRLEVWLPIDLSVDSRAATVTATPREPLPVELREQRQERAARLGGPLAESPRYPRHREPHRIAGWPAADVEARLSTETSSEAGSDTTDLRVSAFTTGDLLFMDSSLFFAGDVDDPLGELRWSLARRDPDGRLLGPLDATEIVLGESLFPGLDLVAPASSGPGVFLSNYPLDQPDQFDRHTFRGTLPPGWEVELYRGRELLGLTAGTQTGFYVFPDVPLRFGLNVFRLVFYGPRGERRQQERVIHVGETQAPPGEVRYRLVAQEPDTLTSRGMLEVDYGLGRSLSLGLAAAALETAPGEAESGRREYGKIALRGSWSRMLAAVDYAVEGDGGSALQASVLTRWRRIGVLLQHAELQDYRSDAFRGPFPDIARRTTLRLDGSFPHLAFLPLALELQRDELESGGAISELRARVSTSRRGFFLTNQLTWRLPDGIPGASSSGTGNLLASRFGLRYALRGEVTYTAEPTWEVDGLALELERHLARGYLLTLGARQALGSDRSQFRLGLTRVRGAFGWGVEANVSDDGDLRAIATLNVGVARDPLRHVWETDARPLASQGAAAVRAFLDLDGDGVHRTGEPPLEGIGFVVGGLPHPARTDENGVAFLSRLPAYRAMDLEMAPRTLDDPMWTPAIAGVEIVPRPGATVSVDFPVVGTGEVTGTLRVSDGNERWEGAGWRVQLIDEAGNLERETIAAYDGFFDLTGVPPGRYELRPVPAPGWSVVETDQRTVEVDPTGTILDGRDLSVTVEPPVALANLQDGAEEIEELPTLTVTDASTETTSGPPPPPPSRLPEETGPASPRFGVQVASLRDPELAESLAASLARLYGAPARAVRVDLGGEGTWHRVIVGAFSRRDEAQAFRARVRDEREVGPILRLPSADDAAAARSAATATTTATATAEATGTAFAVQVASFRRQDRAMDHARRVERETRLPVRVVSADLGRLGVWHRVLLGSFARRGEAEAFRSRLASTREVGPVLLVADGEAVTSGGQASRPMGAETRFAIQIASLRDPDAANAHARRMEAELHMPTRVVPVELDRLGRWHRVLVGSFEDASAAERTRRSLGNRTGSDVGPVRRIDPP